MKHEHVVAAVMLLLCSVGFAVGADGKNAGEDSTSSLILRELFKLQSEVTTQRSEIGKLRAEVETQKSEMERQQAMAEKQRSEMDMQNSETGKKLDKQQSDIGELANERVKFDEMQKQMKSVAEKQQTEIIRLVTELNKQHTLVQKLQSDHASDKRPSTSYIRWGRKQCDGDATTIYKGYAAGPHYRAESGSGSNYLCLHENPQWKRYVSGSQTAGNIYGVQYETWNIHKNNVFSLSSNGGRELAPHPGPCVMCNVPNRSTIIMIPARTECPAGWNKEYGGYVITSNKGYIKSSYICWDEAPETAPGGNNVDQSVIYHTEVQCGTLPCSTYISGRELTCVVCSK